jgi:carbon-monoxide dehydrogenase medium subunit
VLGLGATINTSKRKIPADAFFKGLFETALAPGEMITSVSFPIPKKAGYAKFRNPAFALRRRRRLRRANGRWRAVAVTGRGNERRLPREADGDGAREGLVGEGDCRSRVQAGEMQSDMHASAEYRAELVRVMAQRAVTGAT